MEYAVPILMVIGGVVLVFLCAVGIWGKTPVPQDRIDETKWGR